MENPGQNRTSAPPEPVRQARQVPQVVNAPKATPIPVSKPVAAPEPVNSPQASLPHPSFGNQPAGEPIQTPPPAPPMPPAAQQDMQPDGKSHQKRSSPSQILFKIALFLLSYIVGYWAVKFLLN